MSFYIFEHGEKVYLSLLVVQHLE